MKVSVLVAADGAAWEAELVGTLGRGQSAVSVARRCVDVVELVALATAGQGRAALVAATLRRLDADAVDRLRAADVVPVAVVPRDDQAVIDRMAAIGITTVVPEDADVEVVSAVLVDAVAAAGRSGPVLRTPRVFGDPLTSPAVPPGASVAGAEPLVVRRGRVVAVWGPTGAPGRTSVAVTLADELARSGELSLLVDADVYGATIAAVLGLLDESPGLAAACRQAAAARFDATALAALCWQLRPELRVLTGIPIAARWPELRPAALPAVLDAARKLADFVVVDCGFCLETDEELSFDTVAPRRNGATLAVLDAADTIVVVGSADPIGMQRLVRGLADLREAEVTAPVLVALNRVRRGVVPGDPAGELAAALRVFAGHSPSALLPFDPDSLDAALAGGRTVGEIRPASPFRRAVHDLAGIVAGRPVAKRRHLRRGPATQER